jgi:hypothetical protein
MKEEKRMPLHLDARAQWVRNADFNTASKDDLRRVCERMNNNMTQGISAE